MKKRSSKSDKGQLVTARIPDDIWSELLRFGPFLQEVEKAQPGTGIRRQNPNALINYCVKSMVIGLKSYEAKIQQAQAQR